ncbi:conserved oligomeric golgi complex subunit 4-like protein [Trifolium pratense]|uniref:Conserved oligomeric golgi complex subunit 4-like protein n=1 Tax=Trifolium pratense TaxID=57577 RepID=A0A2K3PNB1_TRIPR|nr:conserved oligomeric golgi complex subunit 4-like protein [Trifolium pratense]
MCSCVPYVKKSYIGYEMLKDSVQKKQLEGIVRNKLSVGDQRDHPVILRFVRLYTLLEEILLLMQLVDEVYNEYMISKIKGLTSVDLKLLPHATKAFRNGKAIRIDEHNLDNLATSMVDDVFLFYVLQSWLQMSVLLLRY